MADTLDYESPAAKASSKGVRIAVVIGLLLFGGQLWLLSDFWLYRPMYRVAIYLAALTICFLPPAQRTLERVGTLLDARSARRMCVVFIAVVALSIAALYATALSSARQFTPIFHDEFAYLLQARMFASGRLWMPAHPLGAFFDTFYVITDRVYAAQYFPGTALLLVPGIWFGLPEWVMPLVASGVACGLLYIMLARLFHSLAGLAGVVVAIGVPGLRFASIMSIAQMPTLLWLLAVCAAMLAWDRTRQLRWLVIAGASMGFCAITRPLDAAVIGVACAAFACWQLRKSPRADWRRVAIAGLLPLLPFAGLQLAINKGVTGDWFETPFGYYAARDMPGTELGFREFDPARRPMSPLPQKQAFFDSQVRTAAMDHTPARVWQRWLRERWKVEITETLPDMLLLIVVPLGLFTLGRDARRWMVVAIAPLWWFAYAFHAFTFFHYYVVLIPSTLVVMFAGFEAIGRLGPRAAAAGRAMAFVLPVTITVMAMPQFKVDVRDQVVTNPVEESLRSAIAHNVREPQAIVLVRYHASAAPEHEVVYNVDAPWPDDAAMIRAHDLGDARDAELYHYYAQRQPQRAVYRFDRRDLSFQRLGNVKELDAASTRPTIGQDATSTRPSADTSGDSKR